MGGRSVLAGVMGAILSVTVAAVASPVVGQTPSTAWPPHFREGLAPLSGVGTLPPSSSCASCHPDEYAQWERSRHRVAATNAVFTDGLRQEQNVRCANCHAPIPDGARDLLRTVGPRPLSLPPGSTAHDGVSCAVCHVRDGAILSVGGRGYGHEHRLTPSLSDPTFCAACHEFRGHDVRDGVTTMNDLPMQSTYSEWQAWTKATGDTRTCQTCHMPDGRHDFVGTAPAMLRDALVVVVEHVDGGAEVVLASREVGHRSPTGDVFRHLTVHAVVEGQRRELQRLERRTALVDGPDGPRQVIAHDTRLVPGEPRRLRLPAGATAVVVTYHRADDRAEARGRVSYDELVDELVTVPVSSDSVRTSTAPR
jgi:hypothetical protein